MNSLLILSKLLKKYILNTKVPKQNDEKKKKINTNNETRYFILKNNDTFSVSHQLRKFDWLQIECPKNMNEKQNKRKYVTYVSISLGSNNHAVQSINYSSLDIVLKSN